MPTVISAPNRTAFLHVPKAGGSSVGYQLAEALPCLRTFAGTRILTHPVLGPVQPSHLPLWVLRDHYSHAFSALGRCEVFALTRAPRARFASALGQHAREFLGRPLDSLSRDELRGVLDSVSAAFAKGPGALLHEFVHFIPQVDFIRLDGRPVATNVYPIEALPAFVRDLSGAAGVALNAHEWAHATNRYRGPGIAATVARLRPVARRVLPPRLFRATRDAVLSVATLPPPDHVREVLESPEVTGFIDSTYAEDAALYAEVSAGLPVAA